MNDGGNLVGFAKLRVYLSLGVEMEKWPLAWADCYPKVELSNLFTHIFNAKEAADISYKLNYSCSTAYTWRLL